MNQADVIRKVRALLNVRTDRGASEAEAATAAQKAQDLLLEYNLTSAQVQVGEEPRKAEGIVKEAEEFRDNRFEGSWKASLAGSVAANNFCRCVYLPGKAGVWFIGAETNVRVSRDLWQWLIQQINMQSVVAYQDAWRDETPAKFRKGFCWGAVSRLAQRMREEKTRQTTTKPDWFSGSEPDYRQQCTALVVANDHALAQFMQKEFGRLGRSSSTRVSAQGPGYAAGIRAANGMSLGRPGRITGGYSALIG